jgi:large subunit ribosomal protein L2
MYVHTIEYDPFRNCRIAQLCETNNPTNVRYILHVQGLHIHDSVIASENAPNRLGNALPLNNIALGFTVHNVELTPGCGGQLVRAGGTGAQLIAKEGKYVTLRLPSGEVRLVQHMCWATIGEVELCKPTSIQQRNKAKAGRIRWLGRRPKVRGVAKNPVDHSHGGGEAKSSIGNCKPLTPWGKPALGVKTRRANKYSNTYIVRTRV